MADSTPDTVVYVSNAASKEIYVLAMNRESGELSMLDKVPVPGTDKPSPASMPMAVSPGPSFSLCGICAATPFRRRLCDRPRERAADPPRDDAAAGQHGLYRDRPDRPVSAGRLLSGQQADDQPDRRAGPCGREDDPDHPRQTQVALHSRRSRPTDIATRRASAATSSWSGSSTPPPGHCRRTGRARSTPSPAPVRVTWRCTRTGGSSI